MKLKKELMMIFSIAFSLFLLMDSVGNLPIFVSLLKDFPIKRQRRIVIRELLIALLVLILFTFLGEFLLNLLGISQHTVQIAGGLILFIIALKMIFPKNSEHDVPLKQEPFIVPLAIPLTAGPSTLAAVMIYGHEIDTTAILVIAIFFAWAASTLILLSAPFLSKLLGPRILSACERLMGLLLTLLAVQMFLKGLEVFLTPA